MSGSREAEPFDPYAFAVQWYMDHPEVLIEYDRALKKKLDAGITMDELEDIEAKAFEFGKLVRVSNRWSSPSNAWAEFSSNLPRGTKAEAKEVYYRGYVQ